MRVVQRQVDIEAVAGAVVCHDDQDVPRKRRVEVLDGVDGVGMGEPGREQQGADAPYFADFLQFFAPFAVG